MLFEKSTELFNAEWKYSLFQQIHDRGWNSSRVGIAHGYNIYGARV